MRFEQASLSEYLELKKSTVLLTDELQKGLKERIVIWFPLIRPPGPHCVYHKNISRFGDIYDGALIWS